jgi:Uncharacterised nucleotidyltransferase
MLTEDVWMRPQPAQIESVAALVLSHEDLLLHLALRLASGLSDADGFVGHVRHLCDIAETCRSYGSALDWSRLVKQAHAYSAGKIVYKALRLARDLVGAGVPSSSLADLRASFGQLPFEDRLIVGITRKAILAEDQSMGPPSTLRTLGVQLLTTRGAIDGLPLTTGLLARASQLHLRQLIKRLESSRARSANLAGSDLSATTAQVQAPSARAAGGR